MHWWQSLEECSRISDEEVFAKPMEEVMEACGGGSKPWAGKKKPGRPVVARKELEPSNCLERVLALENRLNELVVGLNDTIRLMIASAIAQQPFLMIGPPGVAKTMLATLFFELLGLRRPTAVAADEISKSAYFEYLLHSFSIPEELYGPINIEKLREKKPRVMRVNDNMLTGKGIKACFLDEVFKANSAILNTLLTLINERRYFNDSVFNPSDLRVIIGASNETPTVKGEALGNGGRSGSGILTDLWAFYDRWTIRTYVDIPVEDDLQPVTNSLYAHIRGAGLDHYGARFHKAQVDSQKPLACINDFVLLGRCLVPDPRDKSIQKETVATPNGEFVDKLLALCLSLRRDDQHQQCTMNPRKMLYTEMVARAHALLSTGLNESPQVKHLAVFRNIWDDETKAESMAETVSHRIDYEDPLIDEFGET